jgi:anti-anti-sigma factor
MNIIRISQVNGRQPVTILHVLDRINLGNVEQFEQAAREAYLQGNRNLLIDLTKVFSITSAGLRAILVIYQSLGNETSNHASAGVETGVPGRPVKSPYLKILNASPEVRKVLRIAGFEDYLEFYEKQDEAVASYQ